MKNAAHQSGAGGKGDLPEPSGMQLAVDDILRQGLELMGLAAFVSEKACARLLSYVHELKKWNRKMNLIARQANDLQIIEKHFLDSLALLPSLRSWSGAGKGPMRSALLDIGTGAGFPGLVLKAACPELEVTLVEPREKRVSFLKHIIRTLQLDTIEVVPGRIAIDQSHPAELQPGRYDFITSRALTDIVTFLEMAAPFCSLGGRMICMKGPQGLEEVEGFQAGGGRRGCRLLEIRDLQLPFSGARRYLLSFGGQPTTG
jgi:16S rRNA (guanine527-N7)-methyltransferase